MPWTLLGNLSLAHGRAEALLAWGELSPTTGKKARVLGRDVLRLPTEALQDVDIPVAVRGRTA